MVQLVLVLHSKVLRGLVGAFFWVKLKESIWGVVKFGGVGSRWVRYGMVESGWVRYGLDSL